MTLITGIRARAGSHLRLVSSLPKKPSLVACWDASHLFAPGDASVVWRQRHLEGTLRPLNTLGVAIISTVHSVVELRRSMRGVFASNVPIDSLMIHGEHDARTGEIKTEKVLLSQSGAVVHLLSGEYLSSFDQSPAGISMAQRTALSHPSIAGIPLPPNTAEIKPVEWVLNAAILQGLTSKFGAIYEAKGPNIRRLS